MAIITTINHLEDRIKREAEITDISVESIGYFLCGQNYKLAEKPFSPEFLENVAYNGGKSLPCILWLQLNHLMNGNS